MRTTLSIVRQHKSKERSLRAAAENGLVTSYEKNRREAVERASKALSSVKQTQDKVNRDLGKSNVLEERFKLKKFNTEAMREYLTVERDKVKEANDSLLKSWTAGDMELQKWGNNQLRTSTISR